VNLWPQLTRAEREWVERGVELLGLDDHECLLFRLRPLRDTVIRRLYHEYRSQLRLEIGNGDPQKKEAASNGAAERVRETLGLNMTIYHVQRIVAGTK
jgi:hypothetical protein